MRTHKRQHFVPACYLKAWCDPDAPTEQSPYVWRFSKDGAFAKNRAPENIFHETDIYTIQRADGSRDLTLEHGLQQLESRFVKTRNTKIDRSLPLDSDEHLLLCAFAAAAEGRTPKSREHLRQHWQQVLELMDGVKNWAKTATPEQKRAAAATHISSSDPRGGIGYDEVRQLRDEPMQTQLSVMVRETTRLLCVLDWAILVGGEDDIGFITSDHPCVRFDPKSYKRPPMYRGAALMFDSIEITLPISPSRCLLLNRNGKSGYIDVDQKDVDEVNRRTRFAADDYFVVRKQALRNCWFEPGVEPDDSWDKLHS